MLARINCETLEKENFEVSITSSDFIRKLDVNEEETLLVSLDINLHSLNIFDLKNKKRVSTWEYQNKGIEDSKSYTICCSFDKKFILVGGEAGDLMQKTPLVSLHHFTEKMELIDLLVIKSSRDPIINLHADTHSGLIFGTDISANIFLLRIGDNFNLQLLRVLSNVQEDYSVGFAYLNKSLYYSSLSKEIDCITFDRNEDAFMALTSYLNSQGLQAIRNMGK